MPGPILQSRRWGGNFAAARQFCAAGEPRWSRGRPSDPARAGVGGCWHQDRIGRRSFATAPAPRRPDPGIRPRCRRRRIVFAAPVLVAACSHVPPASSPGRVRPKDVPGCALRPKDTVTYVLTAHVLGAHYTAAGTQRRPEDTVACVFIAHAVRVLPRTYASEGRMHMRPGGHGRVRPRCTRPRGASHGRRSARARGRVRPEDVFVPRTRPSKGRAQPLRTSSSRTSSGRYNARSEDGCAEDERVPRTGESRIQWIGSDPTSDPVVRGGDRAEESRASPRGRLP